MSWCQPLQGQHSLSLIIHQIFIISWIQTLKHTTLKAAPSEHKFLISCFVIIYLPYICVWFPYWDFTVIYLSVDLVTLRRRDWPVALWWRSCHQSRHSSYTARESLGLVSVTVSYGLLPAQSPDPALASHWSSIPLLSFYWPRRPAVPFPPSAGLVRRISAGPREAESQTESEPSTGLWRWRD